MKKIIHSVKYAAIDLLKIIINALILLLIGSAIILALVIVGILLLIICTAWLAPIVAGVLFNPAWMLLDIPIIALYIIAIRITQVEDSRPHD